MKHSIPAENYTIGCTVKADLQHIPILSLVGKKGTYYKISVDIILLFGITELRAQIAWIEDVSYPPSRSNQPPLT